MKNLFSKQRLLATCAAVAACGAVYAAVQPLTLPWQEGATATEHHARVLKGAGTFEGTMNMYMPGVDQPMSMPCSEIVSGLGDLWTTASFQADFGGIPFRGHSTLGYDVAKEKYVGTWIDNMNTHITLMEGVYDAEKDAIVMHYDGKNMMNEPVKMRNETVHTDDGYVIKFYEIYENEERLQMELVMTHEAEAVEAGSDK